MYGILRVFQEGGEKHINNEVAQDEHDVQLRTVIISLISDHQPIFY